MRRALVALATGAAGSALAAAALPPGPEGLRGTLVVLPLALGLLGAVGAALGARPWPLEERVAALFAVLFALGQDRLGLPATAPLAALALFALAFVRAVRLLPALARGLARRSGRALPFGVVAFAVYLALLPWADAARAPNGDEPYYLLLTESLVSDLDIDLADEYASEAWRAFSERPVAPQAGDPTGPAGEVFSRHELFLPLLLAPFWAAGGLLGARLAMLGVAAALTAATLEAALALGASRRGSLRAWMLVALAPPVVTFSYQVWVEVPAALLVALALVAWGRMRAEGGRWTALRAAAFGVPLVLLPLLKLRLLAVAVPLAVVGLAGARVRRGLGLAAAAAVALAGISLLVVNGLVWGNPLRMHGLADLALFDVPLSRFAHGGIGLFFDGAFGLFAAAPLWLLVLPGAARAVARRSPVALALAAFAPYLVLVASRREWYGGWSPPFRYGLVALPALAAAVAVAMARRPSGGARVVVAGLAGATALRLAALAAEPGWAFSFADGRSALLDLATSRYAADFARLLPSAVRAQPALWIVPAVTCCLLLVAWRWPRRRPRDAASAGVAALLAAWVLLLLAAHRLPTGVAELEDPWISKSRGASWPGRWVPDRTRFPGGWYLPAGAEARFVPRAGGERVVIDVRWRAAEGGGEPVRLELRSRGELLGSFVARSDGTWRGDRLAARDWPAGAPLEIRCAQDAARPAGAAIVDRVELAWR
ncbi:MAG: hypothetical protein H6Q03_851 [Acidobacteria bacterium]|nr:hypothetical protein [Acidobacteriota bacterium]